ncbi:MAG: YggT family protein [Anaerolineae bacterium]
MSLSLLAMLIKLIADILIWLVVASALLSFFLSPYHPIRQAVDRIVDPLLTPIRRVVPLVGMFDFSPLILIVLIEVVSRVLIGILLAL